MVVLEEPVPPFRTDRMPEISAEPLAKEITPLNKAPEAERTTPVPRLDTVVEPVTDSVPLTDVVAR